MEAKNLKSPRLLKNKYQVKLMLVKNVTEYYNRVLYTYTRDFKGRLSVPKTNLADIPKKFMSVNEYLESKTAWKQILNFIENSEGININEYLNTMIKNWNTIAFSLNVKQRVPLPGIIFSPKMINFYQNLKKKEEQSEAINKHLALTNDDNFYLLQPSLQSNINSLFRLKNLNDDMTYTEIVEVFTGEFEREFIDTVREMRDENVTQANLIKKLHRG